MNDERIMSVAWSAVRKMFSKETLITLHMQGVGDFATDEQMKSMDKAWILARGREPVTYNE